MNFSALMRGFAIAGLVLGLTASASVHAQSLQGPIQNSVDQDGSGANSGGEGSNRILRRNVSENRALTGLVLAERSDDPCHLTTRFRRISNNQFFAGTGGMFDCGGSDGTGTNRSREQIDLPTNYFAEGVRVCLNSAGTKIKVATDRMSAEVKQVDSRSAVKIVRRGSARIRDDRVVACAGIDHVNDAVVRRSRIFGNGVIEVRTDDLFDI